LILVAEVHVGPGAKAGQVATDLDQATGLERLELLAKLEGEELWDMKPLEMTHMGTKKNPIVIKTVDPHRFIGCTGTHVYQMVTGV
jgi:cytochrome c oxidase subunit 5b